MLRAQSSLSHPAIRDAAAISRAGASPTRGHATAHPQ